MRPRDPAEEHRASTPLELFFDLCFVVAVSQISASAHHGLVDNHLARVALGFPTTFFAVWWGWMNFTWFSSAYDTDDIPYRLAVLVQIAGALILAAGIPRAFDQRDLGVTVIGYAVMRAGLLAMWTRAAIGDPQRRPGIIRYIAGVAACQVGWVLRLALPQNLQLGAFVVLVLCELLVPIRAERTAMTSWHPGHVAERYGLFTLIVLGESVLAATVAVQGAIDGGASLLQIAPVAGGGLLIVFSMWWLYFDQPSEEVAGRGRTSPWHAFTWGYGHFVVFASAAAVGAGLATAADRATDHAQLSNLRSGAIVTVPVALYLLSVWAVHPTRRRRRDGRGLSIPIAVLLVLAASPFHLAVPITGAVLVTLGIVSLGRGLDQSESLATL